MAVIRYFVSQQHGDDNNTGLSEEQAWATLTKAAQTVQTPAVGDKHEVVWGPGTYREKISFSYSGRSAEECIQYTPDPNCVYLTQATPGRCRLTAADVNEMPTVGANIDWNGKDYVTFGCLGTQFFVDGVKWDENYMLASVMGGYWDQVTEQVVSGPGRTIIGANLPDGVVYQIVACDAYYCTAQSFGFVCATNCVAQSFLECTATNCMAHSAFEGGIATNCVAQSFLECTATNCMVGASYRGFGGGIATNCVAHDSWLGFDQCITANCKAAACVKNENQPHLPFDPVIDAPISAGRMGQMPYMPLGIRHLGGRMMPDTSNTVVYDGIDLTAERLIDFTPTKAGTSRAIAIFISAIAASGEITCELQKLVSGSWTTQRSKTIAVANLSDEKLNLFEWDTGGGDDQLTAESDTWRYRITADANAQSTMTAISNDTMMIYIGYFWPDDMPNEDIDGRPRGAYGTQPSIGPWEPPDMTEEWTTCKDKAPAIRLTGNSMHIMKVAAAKNKAITVRWWVRHHGTASDKKPQIWLKGPGLSTQTATCTAAADTWEQVSVSITPTRDTVLDVCLYSRDPATGAYSIFSDPEVS